MVSQITNSDSFKLMDLNLESKVFQSNKKIYIILFKQKWCGYCTKYIDLYESQAKELEKINVQCLFVEGTETPEILEQWEELATPKKELPFRVDSYPTLIMFNKNGKFVATVNDRNNLINEVKLYI